MHDARTRHLMTLLLLVTAVLPAVVATPALAREPRDLENLQVLIDGLKGQLGIAAAVSPAIVPTNPLLVSVQPVAGNTNVFQMSFEEAFLARLDEDELRAIVAHELGHVWIFTHHPYLQTERLANTVAMRAVTRASLERVYSKVWERDGTKGDLAHFLGNK